MSQSSVNNQIDADITNKTAAESITAANVGSNMKAVNNRIEEAISENIQNNLMPSDTKAVTANAVLAGLESVGLPYKSYVALISQSGTSAPTANVILNELGGTVVWSRAGAGQYLATLSGAFTSGKTFVPNNKYVITDTGGGSDARRIEVTNPNTNIIAVQTFASLTNTDDVIGTNLSFEIRVYN